jgi:hypothetical protein
LKVRMSVAKSTRARSREVCAVRVRPRDH